MKKTFIFSLFYCLFCFFSLDLLAKYDFKVTPENAVIAAKLAEAFRQSKEKDFISTIVKPAFPEFPSVDKAVFYRCMSKSKGKEPLLQLDLYQNEYICVSFIQNEDGQFAIDHQHGFAVSGGDFARLFYLESLFQGFHPRMMEYGGYAETFCTIGKREGYFVTWTLPQGLLDAMPSFAGVTHLHEDEDSIIAKYPAIREYRIDRATNIVYSCTLYNSKRKRLASLEMGSVDYAPDWSLHEGLFGTPEKTIGQVASIQAFVRLHEESGIMPRINEYLGKQNGSGAKRTLFDLLLNKRTARVLAVFGICLGVFAVSYKIRLSS